MPFIKQEDLSKLEYAFKMLAGLCDQNNVPGFTNFAIKDGDQYFPRNPTGELLSPSARKKKKKSVNVNTKQLEINEYTNSEG